MNRPPIGTLVVAAVLAAVALVGSPTGGPQPGNGVPTAEVVGASAVCPDLRQSKGVLATRVSVGAAPLPAGRRGTPGAVHAVPVGHLSSDQRVGVTAPGQVAVGLGTTLTNDGLAVSATGELAAGLEVEQVTRGERGRDRGLAGLRCDVPRRESWFVGGATTYKDISVLVLVNVDDTPATVDVSVFTRTGPADPRLGQGITVQPHRRVLMNLDTLAPDRTMLAVHVLSRRGRVAAALRYSTLDSHTTYGTDWVPPVQPPATSVVVPGLPKGPGTRFLIVTNPTEDDTTVSVSVTTANGQFVPTKRDSVPVPAGSSVPITLNDITTDSAVTAVVTSEASPVIASGYVQDRQPFSGITEFAFTAGSLPLSGPALMTDLVINRPTESTLILSALDTGATVVVTPIRVLGTIGALPAPHQIRVPAGRTVTLRLSAFYKPGTTTRLAVEVATLPGSGPVYATRYLREHGAHGPLVTMLNLQGAAQRVPHPLVAEDPRLGS